MALPAVDITVKTTQKSSILKKNQCYRVHVIIPQAYIDIGLEAP